MTAFKVFVTICNIFIMAVFLLEGHPKNKESSIGTLFVDMVLMFNTLLIWS